MHTLTRGMRPGAADVTLLCPDPEVSNPVSWLSRRELRTDNKRRTVQPSAPRAVRLRRISDDRDGMSSSEVKIESRVLL